MLSMEASPRVRDRLTVTTVLIVEWHKLAWFWLAETSVMLENCWEMFFAHTASGRLGRSHPQIGLGFPRLSWLWHKLE